MWKTLLLLNKGKMIQNVGYWSLTASSNSKAREKGFFRHNRLDLCSVVIYERITPQLPLSIVKG